jgi:sugar phosphate isomerase/epimerase
MTRALGIAHLTAIDMAPPALIEAAAQAGFDAVGLRLLRVTDDSPGYPLMDDPAAMRDTLAAMRATGVTVSDIEFVRITPETNIADLSGLLDAGQALGARHVIVAPYDSDLSRLADRLAELADAADPRNLRPVLEFFPWTSIPDLGTARRVVEAAGPKVDLLVDSLHFDRSDSMLSELRETPSARLPFAHLCDAPVNPPYSTEDLLYTARAERLPPGDGQIDLHSFIAALPADIPLSLEIPTPHPVNDIVDRFRDLKTKTQSLITKSERAVEN